MHREIQGVKPPYAAALRAKAAKDAAAEVAEWLPRLDALVIGPGLGRDPVLAASVKHIFEAAKKINLPLVVDADGLFLVTQNR